MWDLPAPRWNCSLRSRQPQSSNLTLGMGQDHGRTLTLPATLLEVQTITIFCPHNYFACNQTQRKKKNVLILSWSAGTFNISDPMILEHPACLFLRPPCSFPFERTANPIVVRYHTSENKSTHDGSKNNTNSTIQRTIWHIKPRAIPMSVQTHGSLLGYLCSRN